MQSKEISTKLSVTKIELKETRIKLQEMLTVLLEMLMSSRGTKILLQEMKT